jgi:1,4-dihydroxy-2-naphthoate octaprenyltransferase
MSSSNAARMLKIIRFHIVAGGLLAFLLGGLLAFANGGNFNPILFALVYTAGLLGDLSSHYSNDYFDVDVDKHMNQKKFFAGHAILVGYPNLRESSKSVSVSLLVCANVLAVALFLFLGAPTALDFKRPRRSYNRLRNRLRNPGLRLLICERPI